MRDPKGGLAPDAHRHAWALEETEWRRARDIDCVVQVQIHMSLVDNVIQEQQRGAPVRGFGHPAAARSRDRKSTRLNSSHLVISYAVFCLKKKKIHVHRQ